jgi:hypothetical protein
MAVGLGFTSIGWRWPIVVAAALVSLGSVFVVFADGGTLDGTQYALIGFSGLVLALAVGHALSMHPAIAWSLRVGVGLQALGMGLLLAVLLLFRMNRLF